MALTSEKAKQSEFNKPSIQSCRFCGKECKSLNSLKQHECRCKENPDRKCFTNLKNQGWSKGLTKDTDERISSHVNSYRKNQSLGNHKSNSHPHTEEFKQAQSKRAIESCWENHFGRHKSYIYNGCKFMSSYEVEVAMSLDMHGIQWIKPTRFPYIDINNKKHHYTPDFYLPDYNVYLDPKNEFLIKSINPTMGYSDIEKIKWVMEQNNIKVIVLNKNQLSWEKIKLLIT